MPTRSRAAKPPDIEDLVLREKRRILLGFDPKEAEILNPLAEWTRIDLENPGMALIRTMRRPEYVYFAAKHLLGVRLLPYQQVIIQEMWNRPFPMLIATRGGGKSFLLAIYAMLRALFIQGRRIVITGAGFRQSKTIMNYAEKVWYNSPILRTLVAENVHSGPHHMPDRYVMQLGESTVTALPLGDGEKIRGERANDILADEFAATPREVFETVVAGFGVVELEPYEKVEQEAEIAALRSFGLWTTEHDEAHRKTIIGNQSVISGTAYYQFNHFADYWKKWKGIIESRGDLDKLRAVMGMGPNQNFEPGFDWRDYSIIRLPYDLLPPGYLDARHVARSKASVHSSIFNNEFNAIFSADTNGFFKRSLIESCVTTKGVTIADTGELVPPFTAMVRGNLNARYVYGIDPASEQDEFAIVILEMHETHRRIVYSWTFNKTEHTRRVNSGVDAEPDFYAYCARKIRDLMRVFPCEHIAMDSMGGGLGVREAFHDTDKIRPDEKPIWEIHGSHPLSWDHTDKPTDRYPGLHILELVNFSRADYVYEANHGLRKDFEDRVCLFPSTGGEMTAKLAVEFEKLGGPDSVQRTFDTLEDCYNDIEKLKDELTTITHGQTPGNNRDKWDTPEVKVAGVRRGRMKKDRYSALLLANMAARRMQRQVEPVPYEPLGGIVGQIKGRGGPDYISAPDWFANPKGGKGYGRVVRRG